jgi:hypothetical protein
MLEKPIPGCQACLVSRKRVTEFQTHVYDRANSTSHAEPKGAKPLKTRFAAVCMCFVLQSGFAANETGGQLPFEIASGGQPLCSIVLAEKSSPSAKLGAQELQYHFLRMTGALVPIRTDAEAVGGRQILVGEGAGKRRLGLRQHEFQPQEYLVAFQSNSIMLLGRDWEDTETNRKLEGRSTTGEALGGLRHRIDFWKAVGYPERSTGEMELPGLYDDQGTCLAVYDFLERFCGVRWYGPAELNVVIPDRKTLEVHGKDIRRQPALRHRSALPAGNWPFLRGQWGEFTREQVCLFWRRARQGGLRWAANHTFFPETIKRVLNDAEYQCRNPKGLGSQLCYSNPKLVSEVAQMARDYFDGKGALPAGWKAMGDFFALVPDDNINLCNCEACKARLPQDPTRRTGFFSSGEMSDYWYAFVNAVAREVKQTHPKKYIATLAYWQYAFPPSFELEPNVSVAPCLHTCYYPVHREMLDNDLLFYDQWRQKTKAPSFLWVYYHHPMEPALIERWKCFPHIMVHETAAAMRRYIRDGIQGIFECGEQDQLEQYVMAKIWDDPEANVDGMIDEFFRLYFGEAGPPMKAFYLGLEKAACDRVNYPAPYHRANGINWKRAAWEKLGTAERMDEWGELISQASKLATTEPQKTRVSLWRKALWEWMLDGREQHTSSRPQSR